MMSRTVHSPTPATAVMRLWPYVPPLASNASATAFLAAARSSASPLARAFLAAARSSASPLARAFLAHSQLLLAMPTTGRASQSLHSAPGASAIAAFSSFVVELQIEDAVPGPLAAH